jgi:hypothetical protein
MNIYFDIETIPCQDAEFIESVTKPINDKAEADTLAIKPPANYKDADKIAEWLKENAIPKAVAIRTQADAEIKEAIAKTSFDGALGEVCCIGWAIDDQPVSTAIGSEAVIIQTFFESLKQANPRNHKHTFVGHNVASFDLRFLWQRAVVNGIEPPDFIPFNAKSWDSQIADTMTMFAGHGNRISLDKLAKALGLSGKGGITGADVWPMYQDGLINEIAAYCADDVELTRNVHKRLVFAQQADQRAKPQVVEADTLSSQDQSQSSPPDIVPDFLLKKDFLAQEEPTRQDLVTLVASSYNFTNQKAEQCLIQHFAMAKAA